MAKDAKDGPDVSLRAVGIAVILQHQDQAQKLLDLFQRTSLNEAAKDPDSARGGVIRMSGTVIEIHREDSIFQGAIFSDDGVHVVRFITPFSTNTVYAQSWAAFRGIFVQQFNYSNVSGGETQALLLVGGFVN